MLQFDWGPTALEFNKQRKTWACFLFQTISEGERERTSGPRVGHKEILFKESKQGYYAGDNTC